MVTRHVDRAYTPLYHLSHYTSTQSALLHCTQYDMPVLLVLYTNGSCLLLCPKLSFAARNWHQS